MNLLYFLAIAAALASLGDAISLKNKPTTGQEVEKDRHDPKYRKMALASFDKWRNDRKELIDVDHIDVERVTEQVVAGTMTRLDFLVFGTSNELMNCHSKVWDQEWIQFRNIVVDCSFIYSTKRSIQQQRSGIIEDKGPKIYIGPKQKDPRDPKYRDLAHQSLDKWLDENQKLFNLQVIDVKNVTEQLVAGILTRLDFIVFGTSGELMGCHSEVWDKAWEYFRDINVYCLNIRFKDYGQTKQRSGGIKVKSTNKLSTPGGEVEKDPNNPKYRKMALDSFDKWLDEHLTYIEVELIDVKKVTEQVVAGLLTRLDFIVFGTSGELMGCHSKVWERDWLNFRDIDVNCFDIEINDYDQIKQRSGGIKVKSPNVSKVHTATQRQSLPWRKQQN